MKNIKAIVCQGQRVVQGGLALILNNRENIHVVGHPGAAVLEEVITLQPDLLVYELTSIDDEGYEHLKQLHELCHWTKLLLYTVVPYNLAELKRFFPFCHSYVQGPLLPGLLIKLVELATFSSSFLYLAPSNKTNGDVYLELDPVIPHRGLEIN